MAITFVEKRKRQRYLIPALAALIFVLAIVIWQGFFVERELPALPPPETAAPKIEINFEILQHPLLEKLQPFPEIEPFEEELGRENPFTPY